MDNGSVHGSRVRLLDVEPDLARFLTAEQAQEARRLSVPVLRISRGPFSLDRRLREVGAFGGIVLDGLLMHRITLHDHPALRLLGPGDVLSRDGLTSFGPVAAADHRAAAEVRVALLDDAVLLAGQRFPRLFAGLHVRVSEQHQRLVAQLAICQLPRVEDRILSMLWLLAEMWGHVNSSGTVVPVTLTHDVLGELVGARRPTVSLALRELSERGAVVRQEDGWLLLEPVPSAVRQPVLDNRPAASGLDHREARGPVITGA